MATTGVGTGTGDTPGGDVTVVTGRPNRTTGRGPTSLVMRASCSLSYPSFSNSYTTVGHPSLRFAVTTSAPVHRERLRAWVTARGSSHGHPGIGARWEEGPMSASWASSPLASSDSIHGHQPNVSGILAWPARILRTPLNVANSTALNLYRGPGDTNNPMRSVRRGRPPQPRGLHP